MSVPTCQHLKVNGIRCGCPALRNRRFCYFHDESRKRRRASAQRKRCIYPRNHVPLDFPVLEDANSVQVALMQTIDGLLDGRLNERQTGLILFALQTASANLKHTTFKADEPERVEPWVTELLGALRALPDQPAKTENGLVGTGSSRTSEVRPSSPDNALVGAGDSPAQASETRQSSIPLSTHVNPADPGGKSVQSSTINPVAAPNVILKMQASAERLHSEATVIQAEFAARRLRSIHYRPTNSTLHPELLFVPQSS